METDSFYVIAKFSVTLGIVDEFVNVLFCDLHPFCFPGCDPNVQVGIVHVCFDVVLRRDVVQLQNCQNELLDVLLGGAEVDVVVGHWFLVFVSFWVFWVFFGSPRLRGSLDVSSVGGYYGRYPSRVDFLRGFSPWRNWDVWDLGDVDPERVRS